MHDVINFVLLFVFNVSVFMQLSLNQVDKYHCGCSIFYKISTLRTGQIVLVYTAHSVQMGISAVSLLMQVNFTTKGMAICQDRNFSL